MEGFVPFPRAHPESVLFISLDSCRFDTFESSAVANLRAIGPLHRAKAPSHFTYGSHAAMFVGFTPSVPGAARAFVDSKFAKLFKVEAASFAANAQCGFHLSGPSVADGFRNLGHRTIGSGAVDGSTLKRRPAGC
jgi:hypothetical protein